MNATLFITSSQGNHYIYDFLKRNLVPIHPLIEFFYKLDRDGQLDVLESQKISNSESICQEFGEETVQYYLNKYLFLKTKGYFCQFEKPPFVQYTGEAIKQSLANVSNIVFEVTNACNLACKYCINREMYTASPDTKKHLSFNAIKSVLDYLFSLWESGLNHSPCKEIIMGFYGGEPLANFPVIKNTVEYCQQVKSSRPFKFTMTTNGTLLDLYMDFLVENNFYLTFSLDGDKLGQSYRIFPNGDNSFEKVYSNLKLLQKEEPLFWENNVSFNSVLHNRNDVDKIHEFIYKNFGKIPEIHPLNNSGIRPEKKEEFDEMFKPYATSLQQGADGLMQERFMSDPRIFNLCQFLLWYGDNQFYDYPSFLYAPENIVRTKTGTCFPFSRKLYVSADEKILVCERINHQYALGKIGDNGELSLNCEDIADTYNAYYSKLLPYCKNCYMINGCHQCIFQLDDLKSSNPICKMYKSEKRMSDYIKTYVDLLERHYINYEKIFKDSILN